jgi:hypothetical protein
MSRRRFWESLLAVTLLLGAVQPCAAAVPAFSPQAVFALPDRTNIDNRCQAARNFADKASQGTDSISADDAVTAANEFAACERLPNLSPDVDRRRYLILAVAATLYLAATKTTGDGAVALYKKADSIAALLGGEPPDNTNGLKAIRHDNTKTAETPETPEDEVNNARNYSTPQNTTQLAQTGYSEQRDPHASGQKLKFKEAASQLRASVAAQLSPPAPKPSESP